jgi:signal peptidase
LRVAGTVVLWSAAGFLAGLALAARAPGLVGHPTLTVMSGSMEPAIGTGDLIVEERIAPLDAHVGDIVTFQDPETPGRLITHRVRGMRVDNGVVSFQTQGDANNHGEEWSAETGGTIGRVQYRIPRVGYLLHWLTSPAGRLGLLVVPAVLLALSLLGQIWRRPQPVKVRS